MDTDALLAGYKPQQQPSPIHSVPQPCSCPSSSPLPSVPLPLLFP
jgi:hypothetical protein